MRCLIVDDEPLARQLMESYVKRIEELVAVKSCSNALDVMTTLQLDTIDIIFLDIEMPNVTGIDLLHSLPNKPHVILTTAYRDYAFEAYNLDVVDYLLKPVSFDRFLRSIAKIKQLKRYAPSEKDKKNNVINEEAYLYLKADREMIKVFLKDIIYIESLRDYVRVRTTKQEVISYQKISYLEQKLPQNKFVRVHRSFIVAVDKVTSFAHNIIKLDYLQIPVGRNYKRTALTLLMSQGVLSDSRST
ncbi:LytTR family DNA-binding domain-containing protein [Spirosoma knui]